MCEALIGNYREEHVFALRQALELYDVYQTKVADCDKQIEAILTGLKWNATPLASKLLHAKDRTSPRTSWRSMCARPYTRCWALT